MMYDGRVKELPNTQNLDWFFDNLNYAQRQKVHVTKVPRFGEIWWFFPKDDAVECTHAVIYNVRENFWYDVELGRSAASFSQVFRYPLWTDSNLKAYTYRLSVSSGTGFVVGDTVTGATSSASGTIRKTLGNDIYIVLNNTTEFASGESVSGTQGGSSSISAISAIDQHQLWIHEFGLNKVEGNNETGITSFFESANFGFPSGGIEHNDLAGPDRWTRLTRVEPDFKVTGGMTMTIIGGETAMGPEVTSQAYPFDGTTERIDMREQRREIRLRFTSTETDGDYQMGKILMHLEQGDVRS
jgi:hypothetical protein